MYVDKCLRLDVDEILSLKGNKFRFKSSVLKGSILTIKDNGICIDNTFIRIERYKNNFGEKHLFLCPRKYIYLVKGNWKCRGCGSLRYRTTNTYRRGMEYCYLKIDKIFDKLKLEHDIKYYTGSLPKSDLKPKGMRWTTYNKLISSLIYCQNERENRWLKLVCKYINK